MADVAIPDLPALAIVPPSAVLPVDDGSVTSKATVLDAVKGAGAVVKDGSVAFTGNQSMGGNKLTALANGGTGTQDAATVAQVEALIAASTSNVADWKQSVRAATTAALPTNTRSGNVLTASANGVLPAQDGVTLAVNDRFLVKDEVTGANRGIFTVTAVGSAGAPWSLTRATDADASAKVTAGLTVFVEEGTANGGKPYILTTANPITINTTSLTFTQLSSATADGTTIASSGGTFSVATGGIGNTQLAGGISLTKLAAIAALSVLVNATNASGSPTAVSFASDGDVLLRSGTTLTTGKVADANVATNAAIAGSKISPAFGNQNVSANGTLTLAPQVATSGSPYSVKVTGAAHTTLAASTEAPDIDWLLSRTVQFSTGGISTQRAVRISAPTYSFVGASTIADAATVAISSAPAAGTNATLTRSYALWIQAGLARFDGSVAFAGSGCASSGTLRASGDFQIASNNGVTDLSVLAYTQASNRIILGASNVAGSGMTSYLYLNANNIELRVGTNAIVTVDSTKAYLTQVTSPRWSFAANATGCAFTQETNTAGSGVGSDVSFSGQATSGSSSTAGRALFSGGYNTGTGTAGDAEFFGGDATGASGTRNGANAFLRGGRGSSANGNVGVGWSYADAINWQGMQGGVAIKDRSAAPTGNPTGGGFLYSEAGALKWRGSGGSTTTIAAA